MQSLRLGSKLVINTANPRWTRSLCQWCVSKHPHPMYTSVLLLCIAQALLLSNLIAGLSGLICFSIAYVTRIGQEEQIRKRASIQVYTSPASGNQSGTELLGARGICCRCALGGGGFYVFSGEYVAYKNCNKWQILFTCMSKV